MVAPVRFADPYKVCKTCGGWVTGYTPGAGPPRITPCGHRDYDGVCPSWSPVDGCRCIEQLGERDHGTPRGPFPSGVKV